MSDAIPLTIHQIIATHAEMLAALAYEPINTDPAAFICQLGEIADHCLNTPALTSTVNSLSTAITCLTEAFDRENGSNAQQNFLRLADRHLHDLLGHAPAGQDT
jgi:hypothetical protein